MNVKKIFAIHRHIEELPKDGLAKPLFALYWGIYLFLSLVSTALFWIHTNISDTTFNTALQTFFSSKSIIMFKFFSASALSSLITFVIISLLLHAACRALAYLKIGLKFWKLLNVYIYAQLWQLISSTLLSILFFFLISTVLQSWFSSNEGSILLFILPATYIPTVIFYTIFIFGLFKIIPRPTLSSV